MVGTSDSSHSGIGTGVKRRRRVGLDGAEAAKTGCRKESSDLLEIDSHCCLGFELLVGDDRGGVAGALLDMRRGGREEGMEAKLCRKGRM